MSGEEPQHPAIQVASGIEALLEGVRTDMRALDGRIERQIEGLRDDVRADNERTEERLMSALQSMVKVHAAEHREEDEKRQKFHERVEDFLKAAELAQARKEGALGVFRFVVETISRHSKPILQILTGAAVLLGILSGSISISHQ